MVSLLLSHIQLHRLQQQKQAGISYERMLGGDVDATITALAEQGLERCRSEDIASKPCTTPATNGAIPDLLKDPFLNTEPDQARPATADVVTAMPWLSSYEEPRAMLTVDPSGTPAPAPSPETTVTSAANSDIKQTGLEINPTTEEPSQDNHPEPTTSANAHPGSQFRGGNGEPGASRQ